MEISEEQLDMVMKKSAYHGMELERGRIRKILLQLRQQAYGRGIDPVILGMLEVAIQAVNLGDKVQEEMQKND